MISGAKCREEVVFLIRILSLPAPGEKFPRKKKETINFEKKKHPSPTFKPKNVIFGAKCRGRVVCLIRTLSLPAPAQKFPRKKLEKKALSPTFKQKNDFRSLMSGKGLFFFLKKIIFLFFFWETFPLGLVS